MKNVFKPIIWNTNNKQTLKNFIIKYETIYEGLRYVKDNVSFGSFLNKGASITFST
jgi:hypothetical protein